MFLEILLNAKYRLKLPCCICYRNNTATYLWVLKKKNEEKDFIKHVCKDCQKHMYDFHQKIYGE